MVQIIFGLAGYAYSVGFLAVIAYVVTHVLDYGTFSWNFILVVSLVPAIIFYIHTLDW